MDRECVKKRRQEGTTCLHVIKESIGGVRNSESRNLNRKKNRALHKKKDKDNFWQINHSKNLTGN